MTRPSWDEYFMGIVHEVSKRSTCDRGRMGCVIIKEKRILTTGYSGSPAGMEHCDEVGHLMKSVGHGNGNVSQHCVRTSHAEENAIVQAARFGISINNGTLYSKTVPCFTCAKMIANAGIHKVVAAKDYHASQDTKEIFKKAGIELVVLDKDVEKYENQ